MPEIVNVPALSSTDDKYGILKAEYDVLKDTHEKLKVAHDNGGKLLSATQNEVKKLTAQVETLFTSSTELKNENERLNKQTGTKALDTTNLPEIGSKVKYINHSGVFEQAIVTGYGALGLNLEIRGAHVNDISHKNNVLEGKAIEQWTR